MLDWKSDSAENGWGAVGPADDTAGGGRGVANNGGGNDCVGCVAAVEWCGDCGMEATEPGGGVGLVRVLIAGDS